ncbi:hypothetical protein [Nannocystis pusilla]|uniref:hypothetical protein n=1 Tax=Nannocystis pusilla TaxID=889268 RepID=UPI003BF26231
MSDEERRRSLAALDAAAGAAYRASKTDQARISQIWRERDDPHPLDDVEVLTADIGSYVSKILRGGEFESTRVVGGYVSRIVDRRKFEDLEEAIPHLRRMVVLDDLTLQRFGREHAGEYPAIMAYLQMLEAIRLEAILEAARDSRA